MLSAQITIFVITKRGGKITDIMRNKFVARRGFTLVEIMIVVSLIGLLATLAIPAFLKARATSQRTVCINNLRQISSAVQQWALELKKDANSPVTASDVLPYMKEQVVCPSGGTTFGDSYELTIVGAEPVCEQLPQTHKLQ
jgi:prepilin-type N-terminal cleavage/methylation domain-containing protein